MNVIKTAIPEVFIFEPKVFGDARGFFFESFSQKIFEEAVGKKSTSFRTTTHNRRKVCFVVCIISLTRMHRASWCVVSKGKCSMLL
jgi:hypothetical protein